MKLLELTVQKEEMIGDETEEQEPKTFIVEQAREGVI